jgi:hypothetical protein
MTVSTQIDDEIKKIDPKKHKKHAQFLLYSYCHYILEIFNKLADKPDINFSILIELCNNYILNLFTICLANQINLDVSKGLIDEAIIIVLDYISISHEDEFAEQNYNTKFNDAIHFSLQKMHDRIFAHIPNKPIASVITNLPTGMSLSTSPRSLPNTAIDTGNHKLQLGTSIGTKRKLPIPGNTSGLSNYISIMGCATNKTSRAIIFTAEIITRIFNLFIQHSLQLANISQPVTTSEHDNYGTTTKWLNIFEPICVDILTDDIHEDEVQYSNSVFFTRLTYNLDIIESFINMLLPQLLKLSQSLVGNLDMTRGQRVANSLSQILQRLSQSGHIPSFIYMVMIYNFLSTYSDLDMSLVINMNNCCQNGIFLGYAANHFVTHRQQLGSGLLNKYHEILTNLKVALGHAKKINNKNLITAVINLNNYLNEI